MPVAAQHPVPHTLVMLEGAQRALSEAELNLETTTGFCSVTVRKLGALESLGPCVSLQGKPHSGTQGLFSWIPLAWQTGKERALYWDLGKLV